MLFFAIDWTYGPEIIPNTPLRWYPLMFVIGFFVGLQIMTGIYKRERKNVKELDVLLAAMLLAAIFGARVGHYLFYDWQLIFSNPIEVFLPIEFTDGKVKFVGYRGLASHGAVFTILPVLYWFSRKYKHNFMWLVDRVVITVAFAAIFIRIGNFFNHEIVGAVAENIPWAVKFAHHSDQLPRHPAQLYESICYLFTFLFLYKMYQSKGPKIPYGKIFGWFMILIFGSRFLIEFLKAEQNANDEGILQSVGLNIGQLLSIPMIIVGLIILLWYVPKYGRKQMEKETA